MSVITVKQIGELIEQNNTGRISREMLQAFLENPNKFIEEDWFTIRVDYNSSLAEMILTGHYDWTDDDITSEHFPILGSGSVKTKLRLVHLNRDATTEEVEAYLDSLGMKPPKIEHLLAFGEKFPELQREFPIVALGSVWVDRDGYRDVPCLWLGSERCLSLGWGGPVSRWRGNCRFLAVSK